MKTKIKSYLCGTCAEVLRGMVDVKTLEKMDRRVACKFCCEKRWATNVVETERESDLDDKIDKMMSGSMSQDREVESHLDIIEEFTDKFVKDMKESDLILLDVLDQGVRHRFYFCQRLAEKMYEKFEEEIEDMEKFGRRDTAEEMATLAVMVKGK
jgi:hypothetical protein